jgi:hypothetical protein
MNSSKSSNILERLTAVVKGPLFGFILLGLLTLRWQIDQNFQAGRFWNGPMTRNHAPNYISSALSDNGSLLLCQLNSFIPFTFSDWTYLQQNWLLF